MGAILTDDVPVKELLKGTGYNVPEDMMNKTWGEATSGGDVTLVELSATENKVYTPDEGEAYKKVTVNVPVPTLEELSATENTVYTPDEGKAYSKVTVNVPVPTLEELSATENKVYTPDAGKAYSKVTVNVPAPTVKLSAWKNDTNIVYTKTAEPTTADKALVPAATGLSEAVIASVAAEFASITIGATVYAQYTDGDITVA